MWKSDSLGWFGAELFGSVPVASQKLRLHLDRVASVKAGGNLTIHSSRTRFVAAMLHLASWAGRLNSGVRCHMEIPMSEAKIATWIRLLALIFVAAATLVLIGAVREALSHGLATALQSLGGFWGVLLGCYLALLFGYAAFTGRAPTRLFPLAALKWPFHGSGT
jgi:hypothetical protein